MNTDTSKKTFLLVEGALMIAMAFVLSYIKLYDMPMGRKHYTGNDSVSHYGTSSWSEMGNIYGSRTWYHSAYIRL